MSRASKNKKDKVPKITEEEYAKYISSLKSSVGVANENVKEQSIAQQPSGAVCEQKKLL